MTTVAFTKTEEAGVHAVRINGKIRGHVTRLLPKSVVLDLHDLPVNHYYDTLVEARRAVLPLLRDNDVEVAS